MRARTDRFGTGKIDVSEALATGEKIAECFRTIHTRGLNTRPLGGSELAIIHLSHHYGEEDGPVILPADDAFLVVLYLVDVLHRDILPDRPPAPPRLYREGTICLISLQKGAAIAIHGRFEALVFHLPRQHLAELAERAGEPRINDLTVCRGVEDRTIRDIGAALMPLFDDQDDCEGRLLAHVGLAFCAHVAHRYASPGSRH